MRIRTLGAPARKRLIYPDCSAAYMLREGPLGYEGKIWRNSNRREPTRTNNGASFSIPLLAVLGWLRLEFQHKTSTMPEKGSRRR